MEITREELESLIAEALLRDGTFRPKRRNWNETRGEDERRARITDGSIGIYDPKDGATRSAPETFAKSDALQAYIRAHADLRLRGGIVWKTPGGWRIFTQPTYSLDED